MTPAVAAPAPEAAALAGEHGLPQDRRARLAARRAFVNLKQTYLLALDGRSGLRADWLRHQVRQAEEPADLWLLRRLVFDALPGSEHRARLEHGLLQLFAPRSPRPAPLPPA